MRPSGLARRRRCPTARWSTPARGTTCRGAGFFLRQPLQTRNRGAHRGGLHRGGAAGSHTGRAQWPRSCGLSGRMAHIQGRACQYAAQALLYHNDSPWQRMTLPDVTTGIGALLPPELRDGWVLLNRGRTRGAGEGEAARAAEWVGRHGEQHGFRALDPRSGVVPRVVAPTSRASGSALVPCTTRRATTLTGPSLPGGSRATSRPGYGGNGSRSGPTRSMCRGLSACTSASGLRLRMRGSRCSLWASPRTCRGRRHWAGPRRREEGGRGMRMRPKTAAPISRAWRAPSLWGWPSGWPPGAHCLLPGPWSGTLGGGNSASASESRKGISLLPLRCGGSCTTGMPRLGGPPGSSCLVERPRGSSAAQSPAPGLGLAAMWPPGMCVGSRTRRPRKRRGSEGCSRRILTAARRCCCRRRTGTTERPRSGAVV